jgi:hypothetical protein
MSTNVIYAADDRFVELFKYKSKTRLNAWAFCSALENISDWAGGSDGK